MCVFPADFLRTFFRTSSKSPQKFAVRPYLSENQCTILNYIVCRKCRFVGLKPTKPTFPTHVFTYSHLSYFVGKSFRVPKVSSRYSYITTKYAKYLYAKSRRVRFSYLRLCNSPSVSCSRYALLGVFVIISLLRLKRLIKPQNLRLIAIFKPY